MTDGRNERSRHTRQALLRVGARHFATQGFDGARLEQIADEAGVNSALIRYHFGGKQGLYSEILRQAIRLGQRELRPVQHSTAPAAERLALYIEAFGRFARQAPHFPFMVLRENMAGGPHFEPEVYSEFMSFFQLDREIIEQGQREGVFRGVDAHQAHLSLIGSIVFFLASQPIRDHSDRFEGFPAEKPAFDDYLQHVQQLFLNGLRAKLTSQPNRGDEPCE